MPDFHDELSLLFCLALNVAVFSAAHFFARRKITTSPSQAALDAALLSYAVQYISISLPGVWGCLNLTSVTTVSLICLIALFLAAKKSATILLSKPTTSDRLCIVGVSAFAVTFILAFAYRQSDLPVISNDAMTYHFPAAVQWLQQGKISLFQTWFFNPSNTYSPLAGSMFILWLILPLGNDMLARFVEVPPLICIGLALYCLCRELNCRRPVAALVAAAAILCRPIFLPCMMAKDDLFVVFFLITALVALARARSSDRCTAIRLGLALGLLLATKYTVLLSLPILLLAIDAPKWKAKKWSAALITATLLAGPWYLRNALYLRNPIFPLGSLFTSARTAAMHNFNTSFQIAVGGTYGLPMVTAIVLIITAISTVICARKYPIVRACSWGSALAILAFYCTSPFPEVRFLLPAFAVLFPATAFAIERFSFSPPIAISAAAALLAMSVATLFPGLQLTFALPLAGASSLVAVISTAAIWWVRDQSLRRLFLFAAAVMILLIIIYTRWAAYCRYQNQTRFVDGAGYSLEYPDLTHLWKFVDENIPTDAVVAYSNLYFVYPLQGENMRRRLIYVPTNPKIKSLADLGWLGKNLSGEQLVPAAVTATVASPDRPAWLENLRNSGAQFLIVGRSRQISRPSEVEFAKLKSGNFPLLYENYAGWVYRIDSTFR